MEGATPGPYFVIHAFAAVGHHTEQAQGFGQVLGGLGLPRARWASRSPTQIHGQRLSEAKRKTCAVCHGRKEVVNDQFVTIYVQYINGNGPAHTHLF